MSGLNDSRWATSSNGVSSRSYHHHNIPTPPFEPKQAIRKTSGERRQATRLQAYQRALKALRRLKWKSTTLLFCHHRALTKDVHNVIGDIDFPITSDTGKANAAEIMFKVDFFEFYALLERVLVYLLECFDMVISADHTSASVPVPPLRQRDLGGSVHSDQHVVENTIIGDSWAFHGYAHRFHANVLAALDRPSNPLHMILGVGINRQYLGIAKEFRNRWKEVEVEMDDEAESFRGLHKSYHKVLADLKLDHLLASLLTALDESMSLASQRLVSAYGSKEVDMIGADEDEHADTNTVDDTMDWD